jgi:hypothetical protein
MQHQIDNEKENIIDITINENKNIFYNGETINGSISINSNKIFAIVNLYLIKKENYIINSKANERNSHINKKEYEIIEPNQNILFNIQIPDDVPPSFEFFTNKYQICIRYYLFVECNESNHLNTYYKTILVKKDLKLNSELFIKFGSNITSIFFNKGNCDASVKLQKSNIKMGELIIFKIKIDNKSSYDVNNIKINLIREITIKNVDKIIKEEHLLSRCIVKWIISSQAKSDCNFSLKLQDNELKYVNLQNWDFTNKHEMNIDDFFCSVSTELFECKYHIKVTIYFTSFVKYNSRPRVLIPFNVCHKTSEDYVKEKKNEEIIDENSINITGIESMTIDRKDNE